MVTTNGKSTIDTHTKKKKESKHNTKINHRFTERRTKQEGKKKTYKDKSKAINRMAVTIYHTYR